VKGKNLNLKNDYLHSCSYRPSLSERYIVGSRSMIDDGDARKLM
jgi:hypothetical protein